MTDSPPDRLTSDPVSDRGHVFISYGHADRDVADSLYELLKERGVPAWYDVLIEPAADWRDALVDRLSSARIMVLLLSPAALESEELKKELAVAAREKIPILAARLEDVKPHSAFAYELTRRNWFDVFDEPDRRLPELADLLDVLVDRPDEIASQLEASTEARLEHRRHRSPASPTRDDRLLLALLGGITLLQFLLYERLASPIEQLTATGTAPISAYLYVLFAVSLGSPLLLLNVLREGLTAAELPLLATAVLNTFLLGLLARNGVARIYRRLRGTRRRS